MPKEQQVAHILDVWAANIILHPEHKEQHREKAVSSIMDLFNEVSLPLEQRRTAFADTLRPYVDMYGSEMIKDFYAYWGASKTERGKMAWEKQKSWNVSARLRTWANNQKKFSIANMVKSRGII